MQGPIGVLLLAITVPALAGIELTLGNVAGPGWSAEDVRVLLDYPSSGELDVALHADKVGLAGDEAFLEEFRMRCTIEPSGGRDWRCNSCEIGFAHEGRQVESLCGLTYDETTYRLELPRLELETLLTRLELRSDQRLWNLKLQMSSEDLSGSHLVAVLTALAGLEVSGRAVLELAVTGGAGTLRGNGSLVLDAVSFSDESGLQAGEAVTGELRTSFGRVQSAWRFDAMARLDGGEIVLDSLYLKPDQTPRQATAAGTWHLETARMELERFELRHPGVLSLTGSADLSLGKTPRARALRLSMERTSVSAVYHHYLESFASGGALEFLEVGGEAALDLDWERDRGGRMELDLYDVDLESGTGRFAVYGLSGNLVWSGAEDPPPTRLRWAGGSLYRLDFGAGALSGELGGERFDLSEPVVVPVLDGELTIGDLVARFSEGLSWQLSGALSPVSMEILCHALGWPSFSGTLAGSIPGMRYRDGEISLQGVMVMNVFEGEVLIRELSAARLFGSVPELRANVDAWNLSLAHLTRAFSFGSIEGKVDGYVHGLLLHDWKPVAFDAGFATPEGDESRRRISQNAVDNLASLGGGGGALSSTFLRFFEQFSYDRLGISCRLRNGVCEMGGVEAAERGYYIVKGGGLPPRIDVLGFNDRVAWEVLVERLNNARSEGPIIQ